MVAQANNTHKQEYDKWKQKIMTVPLYTMHMNYSIKFTVSTTNT